MQQKKKKKLLILILAAVFSLTAAGRFFLRAMPKEEKTLFVGVRAPELDLALCEALDENREAAFQERLMLNGAACTLASFRVSPAVHAAGESREKGELFLLLSLPGNERGGSIYTGEKYLAVGMTVPLECPSFSLSVRVESLVFPENNGQSGAQRTENAKKI